ncbi:MAG TPA: zinc transporter ZupT [Candidatus Ozemobacteraceae bacterium]|nr:zinc transporter ZupT [Candidatus Ozemobacteraceae bacterium]HQG28485.1 zinc transporter ZupT [Candidatus Ozemobacteraceae bacterium]
MENYFQEGKCGMGSSPLVFAFALTLFAGLATGIGSLLAFLTKRTNTGFLSGTLGFSAGVMIYVSMLEIMPKAQTALTSGFGEKYGEIYAVAAFFAGMIGSALIDQLVPSFENPHEIRNIEELGEDFECPETSEDCSDKPAAAAAPVRKHELLRMGVFSALAIGIHNFPEGLATFIAALKDPTMGLGIAVAVAIHNVPEGIAVSVPIYHATGSRRRAFQLSFLSGLAEPIGALAGYFLLLRFFSDAVFGVLFGAVAGIMVFISLDELLPTAEKYGEHHLSIFGVVAGMMVMAASILLMR